MTSRDNILPLSPLAKITTTTKAPNMASTVSSDASTLTPSPISSPNMASTISSDTSTLTPSPKKSFSLKQLDYKDFLSDIIIGFADGLTVPFALTAGISSLGSSHLVVLTGLAELFSGSISMGLGAFLAAQNEAQRIAAEARKAQNKHADGGAGGVVDREKVIAMLGEYGVRRETAECVVADLVADKDGAEKYMNTFVLHLEEEPSPYHALISAFAMGISYFIGGIIPMIPYFCTKKVNDALFASIGITALILILFGYLKTRMNTTSKWVATVGAIQTLAVGAIAAGASYGIVRGVNANNTSRY